MLSRAALLIGLIAAALFASVGQSGWSLLAVAPLVTGLAFCDPSLRDRFHLFPDGAATMRLRDHVVTALIFLTITYFVWLALTLIYWPVRLGLQVAR